LRNSNDVQTIDETGHSKRYLLVINISFWSVCPLALEEAIVVTVLIAKYLDKSYGSERLTATRVFYFFHRYARRITKCNFIKPFSCLFPITPAIRYYYSIFFFFGDRFMLEKFRNVNDANL